MTRPESAQLPNEDWRSENRRENPEWEFRRFENRSCHQVSERDDHGTEKDRQRQNVSMLRSDEEANHMWDEETDEQHDSGHGHC
jgi:hypothetical protein